MNLGFVLDLASSSLTQIHRPQPSFVVPDPASSSLFINPSVSLLSLSLSLSQFDQIWRIFSVGICFFCVYLLRNDINICLEDEKMWENVRNMIKMGFLEHFQEYNQTPENIFQNIFWNATKHLKIFYFLENILREPNTAFNHHEEGKLDMKDQFKMDLTVLSKWSCNRRITGGQT